VDYSEDGMGFQPWKVSRADVADGAAGRLWKGEMVMFLGSWAVGAGNFWEAPILELNRALGTTFLGTHFLVGLADILAVWGPVMTRLMQHLKICGFVGKQAGCWWVPELFVGAPFCAYLYLMTAMTCGWMIGCARSVRKR